MFLMLRVRNSVGLPCYESSRIINVPLPYGMHLKVSPEGHHIFEQLQGFKCVEESIAGTALACGFLKKKERRSQYRVETGL
jgi:hypothetical protein